MTQDPQLLKYAADMRHAWRHLNRSQLGYKFRRPHVIGQHIVDFFCPAKSLALEVDGTTHHAQEVDNRDNSLGAMGIYVPHVSNEDVSTNIDGVLMKIQELLDNLPDRWSPTPTRPLKGRGLSWAE